MLFVFSIVLGFVALLGIGLPFVDTLARLRLMPDTAPGDAARKRLPVPAARLTPIDLGPDLLVWPSQRAGSEPYRDELSWPSTHWDDPGFGPPDKRKRAEEAGRGATAAHAAAADSHRVASSEAERRPREEAAADEVPPHPPLPAATEPEESREAVAPPEPVEEAEPQPERRSLAAASAAMRQALAEASADGSAALPPMPPAEVSASHARRAEEAGSGTRRVLSEAERSLALRKLREASGTSAAVKAVPPAPPPPTDEEISQVLRAAGQGEGRRRGRRDRDRDREAPGTAPVPGRDEILAMIQAKGLPQAMRHLMHTTGLTWEQIVELIGRRR